MEVQSRKICGRCRASNALAAAQCQECGTNFSSRGRPWPFNRRSSMAVPYAWPKAESGMDSPEGAP